MAVTVTSGQLRHKITLRKPLVTTDSLRGGRQITYPGTGDITTMCEVRQTSASRATQGDVTALINDKDFIFRWSSDRDLITKDWLLNYNGEDYTISMIEHLNQLKKMIRITAKVRTSVGGSI